MQVEVLLSCMDCNDFSIVDESNIHGRVLVINQSKDERSSESGGKLITRGEAVIHNMDGVGLSRSRNYGIENSSADICVLADNDEWFFDDMENVIRSAYEKIADADLCIFQIENQPKRVKPTIHRIGYFECLRVSSWQISFKRSSVIRTGVRFNEMMGAGSGNGAEEEVKFLLDCLKAGLKIVNIPEAIGRIRDDAEPSTWFSGFDKKFFYNRGMTTRYILGQPLAFFYGIYYVLTKRALYAGTVTARDAWRSMCLGFKDKRLINGEKCR